MMDIIAVIFLGNVIILLSTLLIGGGILIADFAWTDWVINKIVNKIIAVCLLGIGITLPFIIVFGVIQSYGGK